MNNHSAATESGICRPSPRTEYGSSLTSFVGAWGFIEATWIADQARSEESIIRRRHVKHHGRLFLPHFIIHGERLLEQCSLNGRRFFEIGIVNRRRTLRSIDPQSAVPQDLLRQTRLAFLDEADDLTSCRRIWCTLGGPLHRHTE